MCGIVYAKSFIGKPVSKRVIKQYEEQRHRGSEGFGFYVPETNRLTHNTKEGRILSLLRRNRATEILMHHRFPTSTLNRRNACHPFSTKDYFKNQYIVVHNGVLYNDDELQKEHAKLGIEYVSMQEDGSFNDSEALTYDIARYLEGETDKITAAGSIAFIAIERNEKGESVRLHFGRNNGNPLKVVKTKKTLTISSEGEGEMVDANIIYHYDYKTRELTQDECHIPTFNVSKTYYTGNYDWDDDDDGLSVCGQNQVLPPYQSGYDYYDKSAAIKSYIKHAKEILMSEAYEDVYFALELGEEALGERELELAGLHALVLDEDTASDSDIERYFKVKDEIYYLKAALAEIRMEVQNGKFDNFPYPHAGSYQNSTPKLLGAKGSKT